MSSIFTAIQLCYQVYNRCQSSHGEFKALSVQTHTIREVLQIIESRRSNITAQNYATLKPIVERLVQLLRDMNRRLAEYHSLGTQAPEVWDKIRWAMDGGSKEVRAELDSLLGQLTTINTSITEQRADTTSPQPQPQSQDPLAARKPVNTAPTTSSTSLSLNTSTPKNLTPLLEIKNSPPSLARPTHPIIHALIEGLQFSTFFILTVLAFSFIPMLGGFYILSLIVFPFVEICFGFRRIRKHWKRLNYFYSSSFVRLFKFGIGLWD